MIAESGKEKTRRLVTQLGGSKGRGFLHLLDKLDLSRRVTGWRWATSIPSACPVKPKKKAEAVNLGSSLRVGIALRRPLRCHPWYPYHEAARP